MENPTRSNMLKDIDSRTKSIDTLQKFNIKETELFLNQYFYTAEMMFKLMVSKKINLSRINNETGLTHFEYINLEGKDSKFFVPNVHEDTLNVVEINFTDTLTVEKEYSVVYHEATNTTIIELYFKSERVKLKSKLKRNLFRFQYLHDTDKISCRILTK